MLQIVGSAVFTAWAGTAVGGQAGVVLKIRVDGAVPTNTALPQRLFLDTEIEVEDSVTLLAVASVVVARGWHEVKIQGLTNLPTWQTAQIALTITELRR